MRGLSVLAAFVLCLTIGAPNALAQSSDSVDNNEIEEITVTGSRIRRTNFDTATPMAVLDAESVSISGAVNLGDLVNELPQLGSTFTLGNSTRFIGTAGLNALDLRNMGTARTLVLVNGRRHVSGSPGSARVDVNTIPVDLIERVEVITGGASAIYGADAVTGVVNFVMQDDFEGISFRGQTGLSAEASEFGRSFATLTAGRNFAGDSGNAVISLEYSAQDNLRVGDSPHFQTPYRTVRNPADGDTPGVNDGIPDEILVANAGLYFITTAGTFTTDFVDWYTFNPDGTFRQQDLGTNYGGFECGDCDFLDLTQTEDLQPRFDRLSLNVLMSYDLSQDYEYFFEGKYVDTQADYLTQPAFDLFDPGLTIFRDNAFLPANLGTFMDANGLTEFTLNRFHVDGGRRGEEHDRQTYRMATGIRGELAPGWSIEASGVYGRTTARFISLANRINDRFYASADAVVDASGDIVCRVDADPTATLPDGRVPGALVAGSGCVPTSVFGDGAINAAARNYFNADTVTDAEIEQTVFTAFVSGEPLELPAGPVGFAGGVEYRKETSTQFPDALSSLGVTFLNALQPENGDFDVSEVFAEFAVPILTDVPFAQSLSTDFAVRHSNYSTIGNTLTWKAGINWQPIEDIRLRGTVSEAVRAPNISEIFGPQNQNFFSVTDPCSDDQLDSGVNGRATREENCRALGVPIGFDSQADAATLPGISGGNPNLNEEAADTLTVGIVLTPRFVEGLGITADYWNIEINDAISAVSAQSILDKCVDDPGGVSNQFCNLITRAGDSEITSIRQIQQNVQRLEASGMDFEIRYDFELLGGSFSSRTVATYLSDLKEFPFQSEPGNGDQKAGEMGIPEWKAGTSLRFDTDRWTASWEARWIDQSSQVDLEELAVNPDAQSPLNVPSAIYHDFQSRFRVNDGLVAYLGVDNVFDKLPAAGIFGNDGDDGLYDNVGRFIYLGLTWETE